MNRMSSVRYSVIIILYFLIAGSSSFLFSQASSLVYLSNGKLAYAPYANWGQTNAVNTVPDFSFAGYKGGGVPLPFIPVVETVQPVTGDAKAVLQAAIDKVSALTPDANGFRGAILLKSGRYEVNGSLYVKASGVVLRGEGQNTPDKGGTEIVATSPTQHDFLEIMGNETNSEPTNEMVLDTKLFPPARTWQSFSVLKGVAEELDGDKIISFHLTADVGQYVNFSSREDSVVYCPVLELIVRSQKTGIDSSILLSPVADTYVMGGTSAKLNFGSETSIAIKNSGVNANVTREAYIRFNLPLLSDSLKNAVLRLYAKKDLAGDPAAIKVVNIIVSMIKFDNWGEMTLTYETRPTSIGAAGARRITTAYVPTGAKSFDIDSVSGYAIGDTIKVTRTPNENWITTLAMAQYGWVASEYRISYERIITGISGKTITVDIPLVQAMETGFGGGEITKATVTGRVRNSGVENMIISSVYASDTDESHGWAAIVLSQTADCWVRNVTARYFGYSCVSISQSYYTTIENCAMLDPKSITTGSRKYSFYIDKGSMNLFQRCYTRGGRHDYVTGSRVAGPNVFVDCYSTQTYADIGPHHRYATGLLFDNLQGGETRVQNRMAMGSGHGWAGAQTMFWNCISNASEFKVESPVGAMNWGIGCKGVLKNGAGFWESYGTPVTPRSLYFQQLQDRLGAAAVANVTLPKQRAGTIWDGLIKWAGYGNLAEIISGVEESETIIPGFFSLEQNYPNPFNPSTMFEYSLPKEVTIQIVIYDAIGRSVATVVNELKQAGRYTVNFDGSKIASGVYLAKMTAGDFVKMRKIVLLR